MSGERLPGEATICPDCVRRIGLTRYGRIAAHRNGRVNCPGTSKRPAGEQR